MGFVNVPVVGNDVIFNSIHVKLFPVSGGIELPDIENSRLHGVREGCFCVRKVQNIV